MFIYFFFCFHILFEYGWFIGPVGDDAIILILDDSFGSNDSLIYVGTVYNDAKKVENGSGIGNNGTNTDESVIGGIKVENPSETATVKEEDDLNQASTVPCVSAIKKEENVDASNAIKTEKCD